MNEDITWDPKLIEELQEIQEMIIYINNESSKLINILNIAIDNAFEHKYEGSKDIHSILYELVGDRSAKEFDKLITDTLYLSVIEDKYNE